MAAQAWSRKRHPEKPTAMAMLAAGSTPKDVAEGLNVPISSVYNWAADLRRAASLKEQIVYDLSTNVGTNNYTDARRIADRVGAADVHNVVHVLYSLQKQGRVSFREEKEGRRTMLTHVKLLANGQHTNGIASDGISSEEVLPLPPMEEGGLVPTPTSYGETFTGTTGDVPMDLQNPWAAVPPRWPILEELRRRAPKAESLAKIAAELEGLGEDDLALAALSRGESIVLSDTELEYLAFASEKENER